MCYNKTRYFFNVEEDKLFSVSPVRISGNSSPTPAYFCTTTVNIFYKQNAFNKKTNEFEKKTSWPLSNHFFDSEKKSLELFDAIIRQYIHTTNEISEEEFHKLSSTYNNQP